MLPPGFQRYRSERTGGKTRGKWDSVYIGPGFQRFRSLAAVYRHVAKTNQQNPVPQHSPTPAPAPVPAPVPAPEPGIEVIDSEDNWQDSDDEIQVRIMNDNGEYEWISAY